VNLDGRPGRSPAGLGPGPFWGGVRVPSPARTGLYRFDFDHKSHSATAGPWATTPRQPPGCPERLAPRANLGQAVVVLPLSTTVEADIDAPLDVVGETRRSPTVDWR